MKNRIISLVLTLSLCASLLVLPAHAYDYHPDPDASYWATVLAYFESLWPGSSSFLPPSFELPLTGRRTKAELEYRNDFAYRGPCP